MSYDLYYYHAHTRAALEIRRPQNRTRRDQQLRRRLLRAFPTFRFLISISSRRGSRLALSPTHCPVRSTSVTHNNVNVTKCTRKRTHTRPHVRACKYTRPRTHTSAHDPCSPSYHPPHPVRRGYHAARSWNKRGTTDGDDARP